MTNTATESQVAQSNIAPVTFHVADDIDVGMLGPLSRIPLNCGFLVAVIVPQIIFVGRTIRESSHKGTKLAYTCTHTLTERTLFECCYDVLLFTFANSKKLFSLWQDVIPTVYV